MRGEAGVPLVFHCGSRKAGWLGSFQIEYERHDAPSRSGAPTAVMNSSKSWASGLRDVGRFLVRRRPARHGRGDRQQHLPVQPLGFGEQRVVFAPVVVAGLVASNAGLVALVGPGRDVVPVELDPQRFDAERLHLRERVRARRRRSAGLLEPSK